MKSITENPSERSIYIWNITGSMANALISVVVLMLVTRTLNENETDIFSIAWSISQLMATIGTFQIRVYQATDVTGIFRFRQYLIFRFLSIAAMLISSALYTVIRGYGLYKAVIILIICLSKAVDSLCDVYEGEFQQRNRLDLAGKALTFRVIVEMIMFAAALYLTNNLLFAASVFLTASVISFFCYDLRYRFCVFGREQKKEKEQDSLFWIFQMFREGLPLFVNAFIMTSITNTPKMIMDEAIEQGLMNPGTQTNYNILFMPASVLTLIYIVFRPLLTQMALDWAEGKVKKFLAVIGKIMAGLIAIAVVVLAGSALLGIPVLSLIYAVDLSGYRNTLLLIMVGGCFYTLAAVLDNALVVMRRQYVLVVSYLAAWIYSRAVAGSLIRKWDLMGAAWTYTSAMLVFFAVTLAIFLWNLFRINKRKGRRLM